MTQEELSRLKSETNKVATLKECFMENCDGKCRGKVKNAHSLQKMGSLAIIESPVNLNKSLYTPTETILVNGKPEFKPIGKGYASTFYGFCDGHDTDLFQSIENNPNTIDINSDKDCFLLSFRAFAISYHRIKEDIKLFSNQDKDHIEKLQIRYGTKDLDSILKGRKMALDDMEPYRKFLIDALLAKDYSCLEYFTYEVDHTVPVAACMTTDPPYLFSGNNMNTSSDPNDKSSDIITSVIPLNGKTLVIMAAFDDSPVGAKYLDELENMPKLKLERALTWHVLTDMENYFLSPKWYDNLSNEVKHSIKSLYFNSVNKDTLYLRFSDKFKLNIFDKKHAINS